MSAQPLPPHMADLPRLGRQFDMAGKARRFGKKLLGQGGNKRKDNDNPGADLASQAIAGHTSIQLEHAKIFGGVVARQHSSTIAHQMLNDHPGITDLNFDPQNNINVRRQPGWHKDMGPENKPNEAPNREGNLDKMRARQNSAAGTYMQDNGSYSTGTPKPLTAEQKEHNAAMRSYITPLNSKPNAESNSGPNAEPSLHDQIRSSSPRSAMRNARTGAPLRSPEDINNGIKSAAERTNAARLRMRESNTTSSDNSAKPSNDAGTPAENEKPKTKPGHDEHGNIVNVDEALKGGLQPHLDNFHKRMDEWHEKYNRNIDASYLKHNRRLGGPTSYQGTTSNNSKSNIEK